MLRRLFFDIDNRQSATGVGLSRRLLCQPLDPCYRIPRLIASSINRSPEPHSERCVAIFFLGYCMWLAACKCSSAQDVNRVSAIATSNVEFADELDVAALARASLLAAAYVAAQVKQLEGTRWRQGTFAMFRC